MKKHSTLVVPIIICFAFTPACKKDKPNINTDEVRLTGLNMKVSGGASTLQLSFVYDAGGKITRIISSRDNTNPTTLYDVIYNVNEIIMAKQAVIITDYELRDTMWLILDGNNRVTKRIRHAFEESKVPAQRTYTSDTTAYEYDAAGLLSKEIRGFSDSTWFSFVTVETTNTRTTGQSTYTNSNGDLKHVNSVNNIATTTRKPSGTYSSINTSTGDFSLDYLISSPNKTDFSNAAVLNQLNLFGGLPMNKNYLHLPSNTRFNYQERDQYGAIIYANSTITNNQFTYNHYGFLDSKLDPVRAVETKMTFVYSQ